MTRYTTMFVIDAFLSYTTKQHPTWMLIFVSSFVYSVDFSLVYSIYASSTVKETFMLNCFTLESVHRTNQYWAMSLLFLAQENNASLWWRSNSHLAGNHWLRNRCAYYCNKTHFCQTKCCSSACWCLFSLRKR